jgi:hypothetical protein
LAGGRIEQQDLRKIKRKMTVFESEASGNHGMLLPSSLCCDAIRNTTLGSQRQCYGLDERELPMPCDHPFFDLNPIVSLNPVYINPQFLSSPLLFFEQLFTRLQQK